MLLNMCSSVPSSLDHLGTGLQVVKRRQGGHPYRKILRISDIQMAQDTEYVFSADHTADSAIMYVP